MMQPQVVQVPLPILLLPSLLLHIFIPLTHPKSTIEPCNSSDSCLSLLYYILPYDSKLSEIAYRFQANISDILGANSIAPTTLGDQIFETKSIFKVPVSCSCVDGIRRYMSTTYTVRPADTADSISEGFGGFVSAEQIKSSNGINATNPLMSGQSLVIQLPCTCFGNVNNGIPAVYMSYVVKIGESLDNIATEFGTTTMELEGINGLGQPVVNPGDILSIPISACSSANLKWYKESLIVANGSYALTASSCIKCVCGPNDFNLRCWPSGIAPLCYDQLRCKDSDLFIGDSLVHKTPFGCKVTSCIYRGHNGGKIYRRLLAQVIKVTTRRHQVHLPLHSLILIYVPHHRPPIRLLGPVIPPNQILQPYKTCLTFLAKEQYYYCSLMLMELHFTVYYCPWGWHWPFHFSCNSWYLFFLFV